jgi:hypothetical protein
MSEQLLALQAVSAARGRISAITLTACVAALPIIVTVTAQAKQSCRATAGSGGYWSWRQIDGRKCWYEGKPMLSKSLLEWPVHAEAQVKVQANSSEELASASVEKRRDPAEKHRDPLDAQARVPDDTGTFEALWRDRIEKR